MPGLLDIKSFHSDDWTTGPNASIDNGTGVASWIGAGTPAANRVESNDTYLFEAGLSYTIRVQLLSYAEVSPNPNISLLADGQVISIDFDDLPEPGENLEFKFIGQGNTTDIYFRPLRMSGSMASPFGGNIVPAKGKIPGNFSEGDVLLFQTVNDGDLNISGGVIEMTGDFRSSIYLSLFGGNFKDNGRQDSPFEWWGNFSEQDSDFKYRSETQYLLESLPLTSANLVRVQDAARRDLEWMRSKNIVSFIIAEASIPGANKIKIDVRGEAFGEEFLFSFVENWLAGIEP